MFVLEYLRLVSLSLSALHDKELKDHWNRGAVGVEGMRNRGVIIQWGVGELAQSWINIYCV